MLQALFLTFGGGWIKDNLHGTSSSSGFLIKSRGRTYATLAHKENDEWPALSKRIMRAYLCGVLLFALLVSGLMFFSHFPIATRVFFGLIVWILSGVIGLAIIIRIIPFRSVYPRWPMYHAAEHKTLCMLEIGLAPTQENFKKCPKISMGCGSVVYVAMFFFNVPFMIAYLAISDIFFHEYYLLLFEIFILVFFSWVFSFLGCVLVIYTRDRAPKMVHSAIGVAVVSMLIVGAPMTLLPLIFERVLCLKEPAPDIIDEAIELVSRVRITQKINETWDETSKGKASI